VVFILCNYQVVFFVLVERISVLEEFRLKGRNEVHLLFKE